MLVLKQVLANFNQDLGVSPDMGNNLKDQNNAQSRLFNWNYICSQLEVSYLLIIKRIQKTGILIENDVKSLYVAGDSEEISKLFVRVERYMKRISDDDDILNFDNFRKDDRKLN